MPGADAALDVSHMDGEGSRSIIASVPTAPRACTGFFVPESRATYVICPPRGTEDAKVLELSRGRLWSASAEGETKSANPVPENALGGRNSDLRDRKQGPGDRFGLGVFGTNGDDSVHRAVFFGPQPRFSGTYISNFVPVTA